MMKLGLFKHLLVIALTAMAPVAFAANEGTAVGVNPDAKAQINSTDRILEVGADVSVGELIVTGSAGQVQIVFKDDTRLVVGPRSSLLIETYLMASSNTAQQLTINALSGSFRFITGNSAKPAYTINTPTASIAVRGTEFDIIAGARNTKVMLYDGALRICGAGGECQELTRTCEVGVATRSDASLFLRNDPARAPLSQEFRYAQFQQGLLAPFRVNSPSRCVETATPQSNQGSGSTTTTAPTNNNNNNNNNNVAPTPTPTPTPRP